jgi:protein phosphatase
MSSGEPVLDVPAQGLVVLIGAAGAGKTSFALRHFTPTEVLSSDAFRGMVGDDEADQSASRAAFDILGRVLAHRLARGRLSVVDATNVTTRARLPLLQAAALARRNAVAIVLDMPEEVCLAHNAKRAGRVVDASVIRRQLSDLRRTLRNPDTLAAEGFAAVHVLTDAADVDRTRIRRTEPGPVSPRQRVRRGRTP